MVFLASASFAAAYAQQTHNQAHQAVPNITFSRQIAPIFYEQCSSCHHPGGAAPFSLLSYKDAKRWGALIETVTQSRFMPPWLPEPGFGDFADNRRLPDHDLSLIKEWVKIGMPEGNSAEAPKPPVFQKDWELGPPDLILKVTVPTQVPASGPDVFRNFILPLPIAQTKYIRAMQIKPGAPRVVHHANIIIDRTASLRRQHRNDWQQGIPGMEVSFDSGNAFDPDSHFLFWKPDTPVLVEPSGIPWRIDPGNDLILNMHLKPTGKFETVQATVGLYFADKPPREYPMLLQLEHDSALDIPAGDSNFVVEDQLKLPVGVDVLGVYPHAHYLGKRLEGYAILPNGEKKWLILIPDWDIDRQSVYRYRSPVFLPKGSVLHMRYSYDNSSANVRNPNSPPIRVKGGNRSVDEMGHLWLQVLPRPIPNSDEDPRVVLEQAWMQNNLRKNPNDRTALYNLASADMISGDYSSAVGFYEQILANAPSDARTLTALGTALDETGDWQHAQEDYTKAVAADPGDTDARFDLGQLDLKHGNYSEAEEEFRRLLVANPKDAAAHSELGSVLVATNRANEARQEFESAIAVDSNNFEALYNLASLEAGYNNFRRAASLLERANQQKDDPDAHQLLGSIDAQSGMLAAALIQIQALKRLRPRDPDPDRQLAHLYAQMGQLRDAIREQNAAIAIDSADADDWSNLGVLHARNGDTEAARKDFEHALSLNPGHTAARANLNHLQAGH